MALSSDFEGEKTSSLSMQKTKKGLVAGEKSERFKLEAFTELVCRAAGIIMIASSMLIWMLAPIDLETGRLASYGLVASIMVAVGLGVFAFGSRGFRRQVTLDMDKGTLSLTKINIRDQVRVAQEIDVGKIESVFLRRPEQVGGNATLLVRVSGTNSPAIALTGETHEVERVHEQLCDIMQSKSDASANAKPSLRIRDESPKPRVKLFAG